MKFNNYTTCQMLVRQQLTYNQMMCSKECSCSRELEWKEKYERIKQSMKRFADQASQLKNENKKLKEQFKSHQENFYLKTIEQNKKWDSFRFQNTTLNNMNQMFFFGETNRNEQMPTHHFDSNKETQQKLEEAQQKCRQLQIKKEGIKKKYQWAIQAQKHKIQILQIQNKNWLQKYNQIKNQNKKNIQKAEQFQKIIFQQQKNFQELQNDVFHNNKRRIKRDSIYSSNDSQDQTAVSIREMQLNRKIQAQKKELQQSSKQLKAQKKNRQQTQKKLKEAEHKFNQMTELVSTSTNMMKKYLQSSQTLPKQHVAHFKKEVQKQLYVLSSNHFNLQSSQSQINKDSYHCSQRKGIMSRAKSPFRAQQRKSKNGINLQSCQKAFSKNHLTGYLTPPGGKIMPQMPFSYQEKGQKKHKCHPSQKKQNKGSKISVNGGYYVDYYRR